MTSAWMLPCALCATLLCALPTLAADTPLDLSGTYDCAGADASDGAYTAVVTLKRNPDQSADGFVAYDFRMDVPGFGTYPGEAVGQGRNFAFHFGLAQPGSKDFGTGIATVKVEHHRVSFHKFYYEPAYKGGNHGSEDCVRR